MPYGLSGGCLGYGKVQRIAPIARLLASPREVEQRLSVGHAHSSIAASIMAHQTTSGSP